MREILFQGKRIDNDQWAEGFYFERKDTSGRIIESVIIRDAYEQIIYGHRFLYSRLNNECFHVKPHTARQFTGKIDKNGKRVFEGDILQLYTVWANGTVEKSELCVVVWLDNDQCYVLVNKEGHHIDDFGNLGKPEYYEVVGNKFDDLELLDSGSLDGIKRYDAKC